MLTNMFTIIVWFRSSNSVLSATKLTQLLPCSTSRRARKCSVRWHCVVSVTLKKPPQVKCFLRFSRNIPCPHLSKSAHIAASKWRISTIRWVLITTLTSRANKIQGGIRLWPFRKPDLNWKRACQALRTVGRRTD